MEGFGGSCENHRLGYWKELPDQTQKPLCPQQTGQSQDESACPSLRASVKQSYHFSLALFYYK